MISLILALLIGCNPGKENSCGADSVADSA